MKFAQDIKKYGEIPKPSKPKPNIKVYPQHSNILKDIDSGIYSTAFGGIVLDSKDGVISEFELLSVNIVVK